MARWKQTLITVAAALAVAIGILFAIIGSRGIFGPDVTKALKLVWLTDGFGIAGGMIAAIGLLVWAGSKGAYDGLGYGLSSLINMRWTGSKMDWHKKESFTEYRERKAEKRKSTIWIPIVAVGGAFILISLAILGAYYAVV